jgi:hypothetical protein
MEKNHVIVFGGPPYVTTETRTGVPLGYVAEKLRRCLESLHTLVAEGGSDEVSHGGMPAFRYALKSYLALQNSPILGDDQSALSRQLLAQSSEGFEAWLDCVDRREALDRPAPEKKPPSDSV